MSRNLYSCFKAYDIRGRVPQELNAPMAEDLGRALADLLQARTVVVGRDVRPSSPELAQALCRGLSRSGVTVLDLGLCGTEEIYFATSHLDADGGVMVTASHNPGEYNGMKFVGRGSRPLSGDTGLEALRQRMMAHDLPSPKPGGSIQAVDCRQAYVDRLMELVDPQGMPSLKLVANSGNGCAGPVVDVLEPRLSFELVKIQHQPDGTFPNGVPNPLLPHKRQATSTAVLEAGAHMGMAWDGDFDRCFLFDEKGRFIEGYYIVGLLARMLLERHPGARIIHDPRLEWNTRSIVEAMGGTPIRSKTGHAFIKERMRAEDALYGGEMSAHHYFRDFAYCDSGMLPWLLVARLMGSTGRPLSELVDHMMEAFPVSGEINRHLADAQAAMAAVEARYAPGAKGILRVDGLSMDMGPWRFNLRASNTEPVVRLNVESRGDRALMEDKTGEILALLEPFARDESQAD